MSFILMTLTSGRSVNFLNTAPTTSMYICIVIAVFVSTTRIHYFLMTSQVARPLYLIIVLRHINAVVTFIFNRISHPNVFSSTSSR